MPPAKSAKDKPKRAKPTVVGAALAAWSDEYSRRCARYWYERHAQRIAASRKLLPLDFFRGDCHIHTHYSDGRLTVADAKEAADAAGLDFIFITDHHCTDQKYDCRKHSRVWWGQEPGSGPHHLAMIGTEKTFEPTGDFLKDFYAARTTRDALTFVPHPTGWFPRLRYTPDRINVLYDLADPFHMEIMNTANQFFNAYDVNHTDQNVRLWDSLMTRGKVVYAMGNSDAHMVHAIGSVWNAVFSEKCTRRDILGALHEGRYFVSDAPIINLTAGRAEMGRVLKPRKGSAVTFRISAAESDGIRELRLIKNGRVVKRMAGKGAKLLRFTHREQYKGRRFYLRAEVSALDTRRAYTNPIFVGY